MNGSSVSIADGIDYGMLRSIVLFIAIATVTV